jgi:hypothetical protein
MKNSLIAVALLMAAPLYAQDFSNMDQAQIEGFMKQAQAMQVCMADIDQQELDALRVEGEKMSSDIQALCKAGKRDEAQAKAVTYGKQMVNEPIMQELKECAGMASMMIPQAMWAELENEDTQAHVCTMN